MSSINEQVKTLRRLSENMDEDRLGYWRQMEYECVFEEAANTIENLSSCLHGILENLDKRIGIQLQKISRMEDSTQKYGHMKVLDAYKEMKTFVEISIAEAGLESENIEVEEER